MDYLIKSRISKESNNTVGSLINNLIEILETAFQESMINIDGLLRQQIKNLEKYGKFINSKRPFEEVSIQDARKIVHIRYPSYKLNNSIVDKATQLKANLKNNRESFFETVKFDHLNYGTYPGSNINGFSNNQITMNRDETNLISELLSFEENQKYEEKYLLSNEIQDYYSYSNNKYDLLFYDFQKEYDFEILEDFQAQIVDLRINIGSNSHSIYISEPNLNSNLNSDSPIKIIANSHIGFNSSSSSEPNPYSQHNSNSNSLPESISSVKYYDSPSVKYISHSYSTASTPQNKLVFEDSSNRLVNRSINKLKPDQKTESISIMENKGFPEVFEAKGYCYTSSFFTVKSLE